MPNTSENAGARTEFGTIQAPHGQTTFALLDCIVGHAKGRFVYTTMHLLEEFTDCGHGTGTVSGKVQWSGDREIFTATETKLLGQT